LVYATNHHLALFLNFNKPVATLDELATKSIPLEDFNPICVDFAPFLSKPYTEPSQPKSDAKAE